jgi:SAM-dependent methyltransferase
LKLFQYINYFFYIAANWGLRIGLFTIFSEVKGEKKYQINSTSFNNLSEFNIKGNQLKHGTEYMPVSYFTIEEMLSRLSNENKTGIFLDIGCGKGRALCVAAHYGFTKLKGIDFAKEMVDVSELNLKKTKDLFPDLNYELSWADVSGLAIDKDVSTIFLFNPFNQKVMELVIEKINDSLKKHPRPIYVLYASPQYIELFYQQGFDVLFRVKKFNYLEGVILKKI